MAPAKDLAAQLSALQQTIQRIQEAARQRFLIAYRTWDTSRRNIATGLTKGARLGPLPSRDIPAEQIGPYVAQYEKLREDLSRDDPGAFGHLPSRALDGDSTDLDGLEALLLDLTYCVNVVSNRGEGDEQQRPQILSEHQDPLGVFIVFGHDERNATRLQTLLRDEWLLHPIVLAELPSRGRTVIEKFEQEARKAAFAVALLTSDDLVVKGDEEYRQARPNVLFELGWFYAHLSRERVAVITGPGVTIPSDIKGVCELRFASKVEDVFLELQRELRAARLISAARPE